MNLEALKARNGSVRKQAMIYKLISRFQRSEVFARPTWADGPGYYISRLQRWEREF